jgi:hypothetical protein
VRWWAGKIRRFARHIRGHVTAAELTALAARLSPVQMDLFTSMHPADQRHGLDVMTALHAAGHDDPELLLAGLFHDAAKGPTVGLWHRIAWSLAERYGAWVLRMGGVVPGGRAAFERLRHHPERSAEMALAAGCSVRTADLIRHQAAPQDESFGPALLLADEAN